MQFMITLFQRVGLASAVLAILALAPVAVNAGDHFLPTDKQCSKIENPDAATQGWCAAINRRKGNCLACHIIVTAKWPSALPPGGTIAPPLVAMQQRYPDKSKLRAQIWNASDANPQSVMPPFGKHKIVSDKDIDNMVEFLLTL
jgi:sulfur-oxidizing protein SoxX